MLDHTGIFVSDLAASRAFYTAVLAPLGYRPGFVNAEAAGFRDPRGRDPGGDFWLTQGTPFTPRSHVAFQADNEAQVQAFYAAALLAGGRDHGAPGLRPQYHACYYAAFVHDPDGYNIEAVFHGAAPVA